MSDFSGMPVWERRAWKTVRNLIYVAMAGPFCIGLLAGIVGLALGCTVDESNVHPCVVFSTDIGKPLTYMGLMPWLCSFTLPGGAISLIIWNIAINYRSTTIKKSEANHA